MDPKLPCDILHQGNIYSVELKTGRPEIICVEINMRDYPTIKIII
jgi:hypothetical protein